MTKLEPTAEQLELIAKAVGMAVWEVQIAFDIANHGIPEGPPVDTIARRPDGEWIATRKFDEFAYWAYSYIGDSYSHGGVTQDDADSWPVIYDPTGKTIDELQAEVDRLDRAEDRALTERDELQETVNRILYTCSSEDEIGEWSSANDPVERFIEQFKPVKRIDPTAQQESATTHSVSPESTNCVPKPRTPRVVDRQQEPALRERFPEQASAYVADPELVEVDDEPLPSGSLITPKLRELPSLDCEEARDGTEWKFRMNGEPRSLVYRNVGWRYGEVGDPIGSRCGIPDGHNFIREFAPYIEVLGDPS
ncbi:Uncharacterised protein [Mycobacteroides abscessus subsp. bolletii]|uniref:hypothetical protein n=1 Tax=Mycobacteroides abscessus TaxID=36809 RepID=UPI0009A89D62|nr:hypothetical protein [Mycobacteroides abscessus]SKU53773.1 Uncharacterised protein [Mycobacteroides abscessus subsp. bolletii]